MDAERDGLMKSLFLPDVLADYRGKGEPAGGTAPDHRYGCSGVDGVCLAPPPGEPNGREAVWIAYGIYDDPARADNDHQVLLRCEKDVFGRYARPLRQSGMHRTGAPLPRYFLYTGNTEYGVQNLEYDPFTRCVFLAVYRGHKPGFPNRDLYAADWTVPAKTVPLRGLRETGLGLTLKGADGPESDTVSGWELPCGQYGLYARGDGRFYITETAEENGEQCAYVHTYRFDAAAGFLREG